MTEEVLTFLEGETTGSRRPWPAWTRSEEALHQVARWMRAYHQAVADFTPRPGAVWRTGGPRTPALFIGHNDTAPDNAAWHQGRLTGFFDWDFAGPATPPATSTRPWPSWPASTVAARRCRPGDVGPALIEQAGVFCPRSNSRSPIVMYVRASYARDALSLVGPGAPEMSVATRSVCGVGSGRSV